MNGADIGVIEGRGSTGLALEALQLLPIDMVLVGIWRRRYGLWQELECDESLEAGILRLVDHTHAPAAQFLKDPVMRDALAYQGMVTSCLHSRGSLSSGQRA